MIPLPVPERVDLRDQDTVLGWLLRRWVAGPDRDEDDEDDESAARFANYI